MRKPEEYRVDVKNYCGLCHDAHEQEKARLEDRASDLAADNEGLTERLARAERRYAELAEVVGTRTDQTKPLEQVVGLDPRD